LGLEGSASQSKSYFSFGSEGVFCGLNTYETMAVVSSRCRADAIFIVKPNETI